MWAARGSGVLWTIRLKRRRRSAAAAIKPASHAFDLGLDLAEARRAVGLEAQDQHGAGVGRPHQTPPTGEAHARTVDVHTGNAP